MPQKFFFSIIVLTFSTLGVAATPALDKFLLAAQSDINILNDPDATAALEGVSEWIESSEVRVRSKINEEFNDRSRSESYAVRVKPKAWGQRDAEQAVLALRTNQQHVNNEQLLNAALNRRYLILLELIAQQNHTRLLFLSTTLFEKEVNINRAQVNSKEFDAEKLLDSEVALEQGSAAAQFNLKRLNALQTQLNLPLDTKESLIEPENMDWLIMLPEIQALMSNGLEEQSTLATRESQLKLSIAQAELQQLKTTQQLGIDLLGFEYQDSKLDSVDFMTFMVGINLPLGSENYKTTAKRRDVSEINQELGNTLYAAKQNLNDKSIKINWLIDEWHFTQTQIKQISARLQKAYAKTNPLLSVALQKEQLKQLKDLTNIHQQALSVYINYLTVSGQLIQQPLRNWITKGTPVLTMASH